MDKQEEQDWFDELSTEQQADVLEGLDQLDNGQTFTNEEVKKRFGTIKNL